MRRSSIRTHLRNTRARCRTSGGALPMSSIYSRPSCISSFGLVGKKVNFNTQGTAAAYSGPLIFSRLGINVEKMFIPHPAALEQMRRGEIASVVFVTSKPVDAFVRGKWGEGFKFLPVEHGPNLEGSSCHQYLAAA